MPPVRGNGLAEALMEALALIISSPIAIALDIGLAEAEDMAEAEALEVNMSSSIIWLSSICANRSRRAYRRIRHTMRTVLLEAVLAGRAEAVSYKHLDLAVLGAGYGDPLDE